VHLRIVGIAALEEVDEQQRFFLFSIGLPVAGAYACRSQLKLHCRWCIDIIPRDVVQDFQVNFRELHMRGNRSLVIVAAAVLALVVVLSISFRGSEEVSQPSGGNREPHALYESAKKEGVVNIWATNAEDLNWISSAFANAYPGIEVEIFTDLNVAARVIAEARGGLHNVDLVWNSEGLVRPLIERELLIKDEWPQLGVRNEDVGAQGHMAITSSVAYALAYRTDRVAPNDVPKTWAELTESKYRGKMAASPILFARLSAALGAFETKETWLEYARKVHAESQTLWSNDLLEQAIVSGERPYVVATANYLAERWKARGLPVEVVLPEPVFITNFGAVAMRKAPHPNAARLLAVWLAGPDGRAEREKALLAIDLRPTSMHPKAKELRESGKRLYLDTKEAADIRNTLIPEMDRIFSGLQ
jgi:iron(III) transport system substrate-binding protein